METCFFFLKSISYFRGTVMYVQYGFIYLIPTMHKFTMRSRFLLNVFLLLQLQITDYCSLLLSFLTLKRMWHCVILLQKKGGRGFLSSLVPIYERTPSFPKNFAIARFNTALKSLESVPPLLYKVHIIRKVCAKNRF